MIKPRDYQIEAAHSIFNYFASHSGNPLVAMPTGTGKSIVIALFLQTVFQHYPTQRIMCLTHVKELIEQNYQKFKAMWEFGPAGIYSSGLKRKDVHSAITFAGIASVHKIWKTFGHIDLVIIDEAHLVSPKESAMYYSFLAGLASINPLLKVIGFTATPWRLGHGHLTDPVVGKDGKEKPSLFTDVCFDITGMNAFNRLIAEGYLCKLIPRPTGTMLDLDGVAMRGGEFVQGDVQHAVDKEEVTHAALKELMQYGADRRSWLIFASGVDHAIHISDMLNSMGVPSVAIHSKMPDAERDAGIAGFKSGMYRCAVNNNVLTTGFDHPEVDFIGVLRPTASSVLHVQMLGRGTRPAPGKKNCLVMDFARNTMRLGPINDPVIPRKRGAKGGDAPVKECPVCGCIVHASLRLCDGVMWDGSACTNEFSFEVKIKQTASVAPIMKGEDPIVEVFEVEHVSYAIHHKQGRPDMMRVSYYCGLHSYSDYVCPAHGGFAERKARAWWRERSSRPMPPDAADCLAVSDSLKLPSHIRVWVNKSYPEILAYDFSGSAFGTRQVPDSYEGPSKIIQGKQREETYAMDDDIPF